MISFDFLGEDLRCRGGIDKFKAPSRRLLVRRDGPGGSGYAPLLSCGSLQKERCQGTGSGNSRGELLKLLVDFYTREEEEEEEEEEEDVVLRTIFSPWLFYGVNKREDEEEEEGSKGRWSSLLRWVYMKSVCSREPRSEREFCGDCVFTSTYDSSNCCSDMLPFSVSKLDTQRFGNYGARALMLACAILVVTLTDL
ncbi:hypothetical protein INR49_022977 [Caranx melampygus]|nr:hypothetical protein INR49_022977 [Caranx melampygus]